MMTSPMEPIVPTRLRLRTRLGMRARHATRLLRDVRRYGSHHRMRWLAPVVAIMFLIAIAITATSAALPVAVYTLF